MKPSLCLIYLLCAVAVSGRHILWERQDTTTDVAAPTTVATGGDGDDTSAAPSSIASRPADSAAATSAAATSAAPRITSPPQSFSLVPGSAPTLTTSAEATNQTTSGDPVPLPLTPKLTPAVGLAGAVLMITGLAYGIIGIRNKWLYTFFGVAYPAALAVLVLIMYCMNPPVSDGIQGAYFVAVFITGCLCGGVALVFRDLADGFGCLLGGFCLGMWFLTLKEGGTIPSTVGKAVFIGALTVIVGATGLSHRTRKWGLIGSIPFSGATAAILGVDCFSRAGMKEFWMYLWNINDDQFPVNTKTYPLTRGMKVEIAGIIILFLLGLVSQIKLSKALQERKKTLLEKKSRKQASATRESTSMGTRVTSMLRNNQGRYESIHGDKSASLLTVVPSSETVDKKGFTVMERRMSGPGLEMASMRPLSHRITITDTEGEIQSSQYLQTNDKRLSATARSTKSRTSLVANNRVLPDAAGNRNSQVEPTRSSLAPPAPEVVPLPFKIPGIEVSDARSRGSLSAIEEDYLDRRGSAQRASGGSWKRTSNRISGVNGTSSREDLMIPEDDDHASSVAATFDELDEDQMSLSAVTLPRSPMDDTFSLPSPHPSNRASIVVSLGDGQVSPRLNSTFTDEAGALGTKQKTVTARNEKRDSAALSPTAVPIPRSEASDKAEKRQSAAILIHDGKMTDSHDALAPGSSAPSKRSSAQSDARGSAVSDASAAGKLKIVIPQGPSQPLTQEILSEQVADGVSRITLQYRTNEWAKHLENAQQPEEDTMSSPPSPGVQVDAVFRSALEHTTLSPVVDPTQISALKPVAQRSSTDPTAHQRKKSRSEALAALIASAVPPPPPAAKRQNSQRNVTSPSQSRPSSSTTMAWPGPAQRLSRNVSSPVLGRPIVESPIDGRMEDPRKGLQKRVSSSHGPKPENTRTRSSHGPKPENTRARSSHGPKPENTLMVQQDSRLDAQPKSQSFASSAPNLVIKPSTPTASIMHGRASPMPMQNIAENEDIANAAPARQNSPIHEQPKPPSRQGTYNPSPVLSHDIQNFDSHQPQRRTSAVMSASQHRRENLLTNWRESLREDQNPQKPATQQRPSTDDAQRARLLQEKRLRQQAREQEKKEKAKKEERISSKMMHSGDMVEAHRKAMLKMQTGVKH